MTAAQLKTMQEVITLITFVVFSTFYSNGPLGWNHAVGFCPIGIGAYFIFYNWSGSRRTSMGCTCTLAWLTGAMQRAED